VTFGTFIAGLLGIALWIGGEVYSVARATPGKNWSERLPELKVRLAFAALFGLLLSAVPAGQWLAGEMGNAKP
jgi:hypothetical protein